MTPKQHQQLNFLCYSPELRHVTMTKDDLKTVLLDIGGNVLACGRLWNIIGKPIGAGVYKITLELTHP